MSDNEFDALCRSVLDVTVDYVGKGSLQRVVVHPDQYIGRVFIEVELDNEDRGVVDYAIGKLEEVRSTYLDELSIDYAFVGPEHSVDDDASADSDQSLVYVAA